MNYLALDLEMNQPSKRIIQVGICVGDIQTQEIHFAAQRCVFTNEPITERITKLTGLTDADVALGLPLVDVYRFVSRIHKMYECAMNPLTWGGGDSLELYTQLLADPFGGFTPDDWCFGRRWVDVKTIYGARQLAMGKKPWGGLKKSMKQVGLKFEGEAHRADVDAINTFRMFCRLLEYLKP